MSTIYSARSGGDQAEQPRDAARAEQEFARPAAAQPEERAPHFEYPRMDAYSGFNQVRRSHSRHAGRRWGG
jgi:hypothetical protein